MNDEEKTLIQMIDPYIQKFAERLRNTLSRNNTIVKIFKDTWLQTPGIVFGAVGYTPHNDPNEEDIELNLILETETGKVKLIARVCWSDGEMVTELGEYDVKFVSPYELTTKLDLLCEEVLEKAFEIIINLIGTQPVPKYRND